LSAKLNYLNNIQAIKDTSAEEARTAAELLSSTACLPKENGNASSLIKRYYLNTEEYYLLFAIWVTAVMLTTIPF
jgi:hypothetical protein